MKHNNIKNITLMLNSLNINRKDIPIFLDEILISIKKILIDCKKLNQNDSFYSIIKEINYSFLDSDEKELYDNLNYLLRKREYLKKQINLGKKDKNIPRNLIFTIVSKVCCCFKISNQEEYEKTENDIKNNINKIMEKEKDYNIKKIYITFSNYEIKTILKNKKILIKNDYHILNKSDMSPHDINWENLNVNKIEKIKRRILSYFLIIIFILVYFLLIIIISIAQNTFQRKYN